MRVLVTGTPGTGKTTASERVSAALDTTIEVVHLNDQVEGAGLHTGSDADRGSLVADIEGLGGWVEAREAGSNADVLLVESHLAHHLPADRVVVLRCRPTELERRLAGRGVSEAEREENAESEALDVILSEAVEYHGIDSVYEIETTDRDPAAVGAAIGTVIRGERAPSAGAVSFIEYFE
jgi:adenylate kinase